MLIQLPNGLIDGSDLFNYAEIDELRGKQQNYLANRDLVVGNIGHVPKILEDCILALQTKEGLVWKGQITDAVQKISVGDIETILIKIRENTFGERFYLECECPHCGTMNKNLKVNLNELELDSLPVEQLADSKRLTFTLPKEGKEVEVKPLYMRDLFESVKTVKTKQDELVTSVLALSLKRLGDNIKVTPKDVERLSVKDLLYLQEQLENVKIEGTIDTDIEITCSSCKKDFTAKLDVLSSDFFSLTKGSMSSTL